MDSRLAPALGCSRLLCPRRPTSDFCIAGAGGGGSIDDAVDLLSSVCGLVIRHGSNFRLSWMRAPLLGLRKHRPALTWPSGNNLQLRSNFTVMRAISGISSPIA